MKTLITALASFSLIVGCSQAKQLDEMHDTTAHMDQTTSDMSKTTKDMSETTGGMAKTTNGMAKTTEHMDTSMDGMAKTTEHMDKSMDGMNGKMGGLADNTASMDGKMGNLDKKLGSLVEQTSGLCKGSSQALPLDARETTLIQMDRAVRAPDKLNWAVTYVEGFDFQAWPLCKPTHDEVQSLLHDGAQEFFQVIQRFDSGRKNLNVFADKADSVKNGQDLSFNTISAVIGFVNHQQVDNKRKNPKAPIYTMFSLIRDSLLINQKLDKGEIGLDDLKEYQYDIILNKELAIKVLQASQSTSISAVVNFANGAAENDIQSLLGRVTDRLFTNFTHQTYAWKFDANKWNMVQLDRYSKLMRTAVEVRQLLRELGVAPELNANLRSLAKGMTPISTPSNIPRVQAVRSGLMSDILEVQKSL